MQIGSVSPDYTSSIAAQQTILPPLADAQRKDKDGDHDGGTTPTAPAPTPASDKQVNVVA